jgi:hypothetical protein
MQNKSYNNQLYNQKNQSYNNQSYNNQENKSEVLFKQLHQRLHESRQYLLKYLPSNI